MPCIILMISMTIILATATKQHQSFIDALQHRTGRTYPCVIPHNNSEVNEINLYLQQHPQHIPKIIHQIWIGPNAVPWKWINSFRQKFLSEYPGWTHYLWTEKEIGQLELENQAAYDAEKEFCGKADILRYELLYRFGGIYIDADCSWLETRDLSDLIEQTNHTGFFAAVECEKCPENGLANGVLGSSKKNPVAKMLIKQLGQIYFECHQAPFMKTGPWLLDQVCSGLDITIFPSYYFYPIFWKGRITLFELVCS